MLNYIENIYLDKEKSTKVGVASLDINDPEQANFVTLVGKALSSPVRIAILHELQNKLMNYSEIARKFNLPVATVAFHIGILKDAQLVTVGNFPEHKGHVRWCSYTHGGLLIKIRNFAPAPSKNVYEFPINVGDFIAFEPEGEWGLASAKEILALPHSPLIFHPKRHEAQILWTGGGKVVYAFPTAFLQDRPVRELNISMEISSCTLGHSQIYPSDITYEINGIPLLTDTSTGDYGSRYGRLTPDWWPEESSKYGLLKSIAIRENGVYLNETLVNKKVTLKTLNLNESLSAYLTIRNDPNSEHVGGFNIFGENFGDYPQAIRIAVFY